MGLKFEIREASNYNGQAKKKTIRTLHGLKRFAEKAFEGREDMPDGSQEIILSFKRRRIIIYDDYME